MDALGERIIRDQEAIRSKRADADRYEKLARELRREADEIARLMELARWER